MATKIAEFTQAYLKQGGPDVKPGDLIRVYQKVKEGDKERIQIFEGTVLARKHGKGISATITVRKVSLGVGIERIFPIHSPAIDKIEVVQKTKTRRAKLYYLKSAKGKRARLKAREVKKPQQKEEAKQLQ